MPTRRMTPVPVKSRPVAKPKYLALVRKFPLRPIRSEEENEAALTVIEALGKRQQERPLEPEEHDYIAVLAKLIEEYENEHYPSGPVSVRGNARAPDRGQKHHPGPPGRRHRCG